MIRLDISNSCLQNEGYKTKEREGEDTIYTYLTKRIEEVIACIIVISNDV